LTRSGAEQVSALSEQAAQIGAGIFKGAVVQRYREAHFRVLGADSQMREQSRQIGICGLIVDDEAGIDGVAADLDRVAVAAWTRRTLIQRHLVPLAQQPCGGQPGNPTADDRDPHPLC
jgi:hypothetical protein